MPCNTVPRLEVNRLLTIRGWERGSHRPLLAKKVCRILLLFSCLATSWEYAWSPTPPWYTGAEDEASAAPANPADLELSHHLEPVKYTHCQDVESPLGVSAQVKGEVATWLAACCKTSMEGRPHSSAHDEVVCAEGVVVGSLGPHTLQAQKFGIFRRLAPLQVSQFHL